MAVEILIPLSFVIAASTNCSACTNVLWKIDPLLPERLSTSSGQKWAGHGGKHNCVSRGTSATCWRYSWRAEQVILIFEFFVISELLNSYLQAMETFSAAAWIVMHVNFLPRSLESIFWEDWSSSWLMALWWGAAFSFCVLVYTLYGQNFVDTITTIPDFADSLLL